MTYQRLVEDDNANLLKHVGANAADLIYGDMLYTNPDLTWIDLAYQALRPTGSLFIQCDYRLVAEVKLYADLVFEQHGGYLNNLIIWPYDWGGRPRMAFGRKHDDILWYVVTGDFKFYPTRVTIPKATAGSPGFNPSGRTVKVPTDVWSDIGNFLTTSPERIKGDDGVSIPWQKPIKLVKRIVLATTDREDLVVDPFLGTGTTAVVCKKFGRNFIGIDHNPSMIAVASRRLDETVGLRVIKSGGAPKKKSR